MALRIAASTWIALTTMTVARFSMATLVSTLHPPRFPIPGINAGTGDWSGPA